MHGVSEAVKEAIDGHKNGKYKAADAPRVGSKFGMPSKQNYVAEVGYFG